MMAELTGKVALVTGAGSGIGRETSKKLATAGAQVMIVDRDPDGLAATLQQIQASGGDAATSVADVSDADDVARSVYETIERFGGLHLAHNNAGIMGPAETPLAEYPVESLRHVLEVNLFGIFHCLQAEIRHMLANGGGTIVNTASVSGMNATYNIAGYITSKHAVIGLTRAAALEYAGKGIRINSVCPGYVATNMTGQFFDEAAAAALTAAHPINRICQPEEVADAVAWLLSERSSYVLGAELVIDGGYRLM